jgi:16S rRNA C967 or C1407 C5-methylase (RsmB/RsmF family)
MNINRVKNSVNDCILRFRASRKPIKNVAADVAKLSRLNSAERRFFYDLVFRWCRESYLCDEFLRKEMRFFGGKSRQEKDQLALMLLTDALELAAAYHDWLKDLGPEKNLCALGPFFRAELEKHYGSEAALAAAAFLQMPAKYLAFDRQSLKKESVIAGLLALGITATPHQLVKNALLIDQSISQDALNEHFGLDLWFMDAGSQFIAEVVKPKAHERVLDLCAGEGGKARFISSVPCDYVAVDIDERRLLKAKQRMKRPLVYMTADARNLRLEAESFDWVLLDAPCSGSGTLRRHPDLNNRFFKEDLEPLLKLQEELLSTATKMLREGATLIYATCSYFNGENEQQINKLMASNKSLKRVKLRDLVDEQISLSQHDLDKYSFEISPYIHNCDGFYIAALRKNSSCA